MMQSRPRQVSPLSLDTNEASIDPSFLARYEAVGSPYDAAAPSPMRGPQISPTGQRISPPLSRHGGSSGGSRSRSVSSQVSSAGGGLYSPAMSDGGGRPLTARNEESLLQHYYAFKEFLAPQVDLNNSSNPSRARDKLMRLSATQYFELSTDVYDELRRRQDEQSRRGQDVPRHLLPTRDFHPKRNQARQKLATLPHERFKQLATDVYFESERRVPRLNGGNIERSASPALSTASSYRGPGRGPGARGPPTPTGGYRGPPTPTGRGPPERGQFPMRSSSRDYGRPLPKVSQSNTIVPNVSTMVEDDDTEDEGGVDSSALSGGSNNPQYESQISDLTAKIASLEGDLRKKDDEIQRLETSGQEREAESTLEKDDWKKVQGDLERRIAELEAVGNDHSEALDRAHDSHAQREMETRREMDQAVAQLNGQINTLNTENSLLKLQGGPSPEAGNDELERRCEALQQQLEAQRRVTDEVRENASHFLSEMRLLSQESEAALEKEETLRHQISALEAEVEDWKTRYAKSRTELRTLKASSTGLSLANMSDEVLAARQSFLSRDGLVNDVDVTSFQMSIDALLHAARQDGTEPTLDKMKVVIAHVQQMTAAVKHEYTGLPSPAESPDPMSRMGSPRSNVAGGRSAATTLKAGVARNATALITATRNYVASDGLSPVSLVDAAAANLTASVVDFCKTVGIKPSGDSEDEYETLQPTVHVEQKQQQTQQQPPQQGMANGWHSRLKGSFDSIYSHDRDDESVYSSFR